MSFSVTVQRPYQSRPIDFGSASEEEIEKWHEDERAFICFEAPIASDGLFYHFYALIASELGLPLLTQAYSHGLGLDTAEDLTQLLLELEALEAEWVRRDLRGQWQDELHGPARWLRLQEGAADLKTAALLAIEQQFQLHLG